jgi:hypothetical protein
LRDNGFQVGSPRRAMRSRSALAAAVRASSLQSALRALFCATHSDWEKFDEIFDAFWRGRTCARARLRARAGNKRGRASARRELAPACSDRTRAARLDVRTGAGARGALRRNLSAPTCATS